MQSSSLLLDGVLGRADTNSPISGLSAADALTIAAWIKPSFDTGPTGEGHAWEIVSIAKASSGGSSQYLGFRIDEHSKKLQVGIDNGTTWADVLSGNPIVENEWTHVAITVAEGSWGVTFYTNGEPSGGGTVDRPLTTLDSLTIGALRMHRDESQVTEHHFKGQMKQVQVWNTALTGEEVSQYMTTPPAGGTPNLIGLWLFDEGHGTHAADSSGYSNHATLFAASWAAP